jgi:hypothetical protein
MSREDDARVAAEQWLALVDAGRYGDSWKEAAALFKGAIDAAGWEAAAKGVRAPLGAMKTRAIKSAQAANSLPGAPDGEYVVLQFESSFEHKAQAVETVTPMKDPDGAWRVSGYFIK